jgi:hypothetical protein
MLLKQVGPDNGDKGLQGKILNLKFGEFRYYPQDNLNLEFASPKQLTREKFVILLAKYFPDYIISPREVDEEELDNPYWIGSIGMMEEINDEKYYNPIVINKGYICFKEATKEEDGVVYYIHNGSLFIYDEQYKEELQ